MKKFKKLASLLLAAMMVLAMAIPAMAEEAVSKNIVTVQDTDGNVDIIDHQFTAYQIFSGTQTSTENPKETLTDIQWGTGVNKDTVLEKVKEISEFATCETAREVAETLEKNKENSSVLESFIAKLKDVLTTGTVIVSGETELTELGYYLFVDSGTLADTDDARNASLLQVTNEDKGITITVKTDKPSVEKKVQENVKNIEGNKLYGDQYNDVADYNIGDDVPFQFYSKVPDMTYYEEYEFIFHDTMEKGLTFNEESLQVKIGETVLDKAAYTVTKGTTDGETFQVKIILKDVSGEKYNKGASVNITYTAKLNENAEIGLPGNKNTVQLEYSNNPDGEGTGKTTPDTVIVFTYELDVTKKDGKNKQPLEGAEFVLYNNVNPDVAQYAKVGEDGTFIEWTTKENATTLKSGVDGKFSIKGLDDGTYYLQETKAPNGYNLLTKAITLVVKANTSNGQEWAGDANYALTELQIDITGGENEDKLAAVGNKEEGTVSADVINNKGAVLPETGGIGTTIFYVLGSILVLGAVIVLVTKKRMSVEK